MGNGDVGIVKVPCFDVARLSLNNAYALHIGSEADATGIGIPAFIIAVRYWSIPVLDWVSLF
jgi:hypothetical protein